jgi:hypothetical protein
VRQIRDRPGIEFLDGLYELVPEIFISESLGPQWKRRLPIRTTL